MSGTNLPEGPENFDIQLYKSPKNPRELQKTHVAFTGSPQQHPYDSEKVILIAIYSIWRHQAYRKGHFDCYIQHLGSSNTSKRPS